VAGLPSAPTPLAGRLFLVEFERAGPSDDPNVGLLGLVGEEYIDAIGSGLVGSCGEAVVTEPMDVIPGMPADAPVAAIPCVAGSDCPNSAKPKDWGRALDRLAIVSLLG
jgi:hypothetical protein